MPERPEPLDVWLYGKRLASVTQPHPGRVHHRLDFTDEALDSDGEGRRLLPLALAVSRVAIADSPGGRIPVSNFLEGRPR